MEIRRFGPGHRRRDAPPGTQGVSGQVLWNDARANVAELAFGRRALVAPQTSPATTLFIVVSGGGYVQVGDEHVAINHGEAVVWPAGEPHAAWTDGSEMRAITVELAEGEAPELVLDGRAELVDTTRPDRPGADPAGEPGSGRGASPPPSPVTPARGSLAERPGGPEDHDEREGEPW